MPQQSFRRWPIVLLVLVALLPFAAEAQFDRNGQNAEIRVNQTVSVGRGWQTVLPDIGVESVVVTLRRTSGSDRTFVNLRFGERGLTFENGKREYLRDNGTHTVEWNLKGERSSGRPLVLNVYDGEIYVDSIRVSYSGSGQIFPQPRPTNNPPRPPYGSGNNNNYPRPRPPYGGNEDYSTDNHYGGSQNDEIYRRCRYQRDNRRPRIEVGRIRPSGGIFSGKYRLEGSIFASCVQEAGYFEQGRLKEKIPFPMDDRFNRQEFSVPVRSGKNGELRVYTINGGEEFISIDDELRQTGNSGTGGGVNDNPLGNFGF